MVDDGGHHLDDGGHLVWVLWFGLDIIRWFGLVGHNRRGGVWLWTSI